MHRERECSKEIKTDREKQRETVYGRQLMREGEIRCTVCLVCICA